MSSDPSGEFHRIRRLPPYVFAEVNTAKAKARGAGEDIIDLGMGNPDSPTPPHIVAKLIETVQDPRSHRYSVSKGIPGLRRALAAYYERRFGVGLNPETEVVATLGSKEGLANLCLGDHQPGRHHPGAESVLSDPPVRLHHRRRGGAQHSGHPGRGHAAGAGPCGAALGAEADRIDRQLSLESNSLSGGPRLLQGDRGLRPQARDLGDVRSGLRGNLLRRQGAAVDPAGARREGHRGGVHQPVEDLLHAGVADGIRGGQSAPDQRADADEILSRLRRVHADPGRGRHRADRPAGLRRADAQSVSRAPRRADQGTGVGGVGDAEPRGIDVRVGPDPADDMPRWAASSSPSCCWSAPRSRSRPGWASASTARATSASPWSRTPTGCGRRFAISAASCRPGPTSPNRSCPRQARHDPSAVCRPRRAWDRRRRRVEDAARQCRHRYRPGRPADRRDGGLGPRPVEGSRVSGHRSALV